MTYELTLHLANGEQCFVPMHTNQKVTAEQVINKVFSKEVEIFKCQDERRDYILVVTRNIVSIDVKEVDEDRPDSNGVLS